MAERGDEDQHYAEKYALSVSEIRELREAFQLFDPDGEGFLHLREMKHAIKSLGFDPAESTMKLIKKMFKGKNGYIDFNEFLRLMTMGLSVENDEADLATLFNLFDQDSNGTIKFDDLKRVAGEIQEVISDDELKEMISRADLNGSGDISFEEFCAIMTKGSSN